MRNWEVVAVVVGTALLVSCSSPEEAAPAATLSPAAATQSPSPQPTPQPIDTATVPDDIDEDYVQAVMDDIDAAIGTVFRKARKAGRYGEAWHADMRSIYTKEAVGQQSKAFVDHGFRKLARRPANPTTDVEELVEADPACVFFTAVRKISPLFKRPIKPVQPYYIVLGRTEPDGVNPTAWVVAFESYFPEGNAPTRICKGGGA